MKTWQRGLIVIITGVTLGGLGTGYFLWQKQNAQVVSPKVNSQVSPTPTQELTTWTDEAGFSFQYPKELSLNPHDEDNDNYAHLEFTNKNYPGNLIVWAKDISAKDLNAWIKSEKRFANANTLDTTLAGKPAKKILLETPIRVLITGTIDSGIVFRVETTPTSQDYWSKVHDTITSTFAFTSQQNAGSTSSSGSDQSVDEEEVIQ